MITVLQGTVMDQTELAGILNTLYEFHLPLLSVKYLGHISARSKAPKT